MAEGSIGFLLMLGIYVWPSDFLSVDGGPTSDTHYIPMVRCSARIQDRCTGAVVPGRQTRYNLYTPLLVECRVSNGVLPESRYLVLVLVSYNIY